MSMTERSEFGSIPIQQMPDFEAAIDAYREVLAHVHVDPESLTKNVEAVRTNNKTRKHGNSFINRVNRLSRSILPSGPNGGL